MNKRSKILLVEDDPIRAAAIDSLLSEDGRFDLPVDIRTCQQTACATADWSDYAAAIVDIEQETTAALAAAWKLRHARPDLDVILLAPSARFQTPVEIVELGLGPLVFAEKGTYPDLPGTLTALTEESCLAIGSGAINSDLRVRHQELRDITDSLARQSVHLIRLRNELAAEKGKLETIINSMTDGMAFFGLDGGLELCNRVARHFFPQLEDPDKFTHENFGGHLKERKVARPATIGINSADTFEVEVGEAALLVRMTRVSGGADDETGVLYLFTDVTRDRKYEELKNDFTSMISHELRTPLTSIKAAVDNFLRGNLGQVNETQTKFLQLISRNVDRQQGLIDNLLDLAKFEAGQMDVRLEKVDVRTVIGYTVEQYSLAFRDKGVGLIYNNPATEEAPPLWIDSPMLIQALENLLNNALKFTEKGGSVRVDLVYTHQGDEGVMELSVTDTGVGIAEEKQTRVFQKYSQADTGSRRRYTGTGLGLAIVREIAEAHNGSIDVESRLGEGSCFTLRIPIVVKGEK